MTSMLEKIKRFFTPEHMVAPSLVQGGLPSVKEGYSRSLSLAWPSALESVLVALVSSVDTMMVGSLGPAAISAVGITGQPRFLLMAAIISLNTGVTAVVARRKGEGDLDGACRTLKQSVIICFFLDILMVLAAMLVTQPILRLAGAQDEYIAQAVDYFRIVMAGQFFSCLGMTINAAQRGFGNTKVSMRSNIAANLVNIFFNYLLINGIWIFPRLEVRGAAIATAIGSVVAFFMALSSVLKHDYDKLSIVTGAKWRFDKRTVTSIVKVSSSTLVEQVFMRIGFFSYASLVARLGTLAYATHQICMSIVQIGFSFADGLGIAATSLVGQGLGQKRPDLSMIYGKIGQRCAMAIGVVASIMILIFRRELIALFTTDPQIIELGAQICIITAVISLVQTSQVVISGCLRGAGDSKFVAVSSFLSVGIVRPGLSWVLCYPIGWGLHGAWLGFLLDQILRLTLNFTRFRGAKWTKIEL